MATDNATLYFSEDEKEQFKNDGFLIVRNLFSSEEMQRISEAVDELANRPPEIGKQCVYYEDSVSEEGKRIISRIEDFLDYSPGLKDAIYDSRIMGRLADLFGEPPVLFKEKINYKYPGEKKTEPHQDVQSNWLDFAKFYISVLISVDDSTIENGCLELTRGHNEGVVDGYWEPLSKEFVDKIEFEYVSTEAGDVLFFDCFVPHQSQPNLSRESRRNMYITYNRQSEGDHRRTYLDDKRKSFPPDFERDPSKVYRFQV